MTHDGRPSLPRRAALLGAALLTGGLFTGGLAGCAPGRGLPPLPVPDSEPPYRLGADDVVRVTVFEEARLSGSFRIGDAGTVSLPLLGTVAAGGLTTVELRERLNAELKRRGLIDDPSVAVEVATYRPIFVLGEVDRGGAFPWQPGMTALAAVALAGGFTPRAVRDRVTVTRAAEPGETAREYLAARTAPLLAGDVVTVLERRF